MATRKATQLSIQLYWRAIFELARGDSDFGTWDNTLVREIQRMSLEAFQGHPFTEFEMMSLRSLFNSSLHVLMHKKCASYPPTTAEIMAWVKKPIHSLHLPLYVKWYLLKRAVDAGNEEAKTLLREHLLQYSRERKK